MCLVCEVVMGGVSILFSGIDICIDNNYYQVYGAMCILRWFGLKQVFLNFLRNLPNTLQKYVYYHFLKFFLNMLKFLSSNFFHNFFNISQKLFRIILQFSQTFFIFPRNFSLIASKFSRILHKIITKITQKSKKIPPKTYF